MSKCVICGHEIKDAYGGHNAQPVMKGRCCSQCNAEVVVPARIKAMEEKESDFEIWKQE